MKAKFEGCTLSVDVDGDDFQSIIFDNDRESDVLKVMGEAGMLIKVGDDKVFMTPAIEIFIEGMKVKIPIEAIDIKKVTISKS